MKLIVKSNRVGPIINGHPWIFSGALKSIPEGLESGAPVFVYGEDSKFLGQGYFNSYSQISVRLWSYDENEAIDEKFFEKRILQALKLRRRFIDEKKTNAYRLINGENDFLPGLVVDKYADYLVVQFHTRGMEKFHKEIVVALKKIIDPKGIYERSSQRAKQVEGAGMVSGLISGEVPDLIKIKENGLLFHVDVKNGQKTGFFLDQRDKRLAVQNASGGKTVLNCFSYTAGFSVYALSGGANKTVSVDVSGEALELAKENVRLNKLNLKKCEFVCADVKDYLKTEKNKYDIVILDPPAFIKDRHKIQEGLKGYRRLNEQGAKVCAESALLITCSCSSHLSMEDFRFVVCQGISVSHRSAQIVGSLTHSCDHPLLPAFTESDYLKCLILDIS